MMYCSISRAQQIQADKPDSLRPDVLVESGLDTDIWGAHGLLGELADLLDGSRSALLETHTVDALVQVDGVVTGHHLIDGRLPRLLTLLFGHLSRIIQY